MELNRHNYETFFLLYVDGELSATEKEAVDRFVQENPDLANELSVLQQTTLPADISMEFINKDSLYRSLTGSVDTSNHDEKFLLYVDNELSSAERAEVETFVLQHPQVQDNFTLLKQTKLEAETILFPGKRSLYREEKKERPLIYFRSWQAVAAIFIAMAFLVWILLPANKKELGTGLASTIKTNSPATTPLVKDNIPVAAPVIKTTVAHASTNTASATVIKKINKEVTPEVSPVLVKNIQPATAVNNSPALAINNVAAPKVSLEDRPMIIAKAENKNPDQAPVVINTAANTQPALVQQAVYKELDTQQDDKNGTVYIGNMEINKGKLFGLLKKAGRLFSKPRDENAKSSIAGIPISPKS